MYVQIYNSCTHAYLPAFMQLFRTCLLRLLKLAVETVTGRPTGPKSTSEALCVCISVL